MEEAGGAAGTVRTVSRRLVRPSIGDAPPPEDIHLTPWDLRLISVDYIQKGLLLPAPPDGGDRLVGTLASSLARALGRYYHLAGRLAVEERGDGTLNVILRCTGEGAELVHATAPGVAVADIAGSLYTPSWVVRALFPSNGVLGADAAIDSLPVLSAQVTEFADGVFTGVSLNHSLGDGFVFWEFLHAWSEINRGGGATRDLSEISARVHRREPQFRYFGSLMSGGAALMTGSSPRFDVFGNDFGWGKPAAVRSGGGSKMDGKATVYEGPERGGNLSLEVCISPDAMERLVADEEFMDAVTMLPAQHG
ncbi:unnamed protein product [Triticum turgidum subsp. durum]|uniref:Acetyltransferase n=1 Tax=Triticum turgidum subsp. durum TaxID=4567 RepID=A0A9R0QYM6_TRITD|nr:unnamed protein product [Triticum turgidum subsp. durum]